MDVLKPEASDLAPLLQALAHVTEELNRLDRAFADTAAAYAGNDFPEQDTLVITLENMILSATHEAAGQIGFLCNDIARLEKFILFRRKWRLLHDTELAALIDGPGLAQPAKKRLLHLMGGPQALVETTDNVRRDWSDAFANASYSKMKAKMLPG